MSADEESTQNARAPSAIPASDARSPGSAKIASLTCWFLFVVPAEAKGVKCFRASDFDGAIFHFSESLKLGPADTAQVLGNRAAAFEKIGDFEAALDDSVKAVEANPDYLKGYFRQATALLAMNRYSEALKASDAGLRRQPRNTQLQELKAKAEEMARANGDDEEDDGEEEEESESEGEEDEEEDEEEAGTPFGHQRSQSSGSASGSRPTPMESDEPPEERAEKAKAAGNAQYKAGQYDSAIRLYSEAVRLMPQNATYLINRAAAALMVQKAEEALSDASAAISLDPNLVKAHLRKAKALAQLGRLSDARRILEAARDALGEDASLDTELVTITELETAFKSASDILSQEGGPAAREALRLFTLLVERCPCSEKIACQQMEALLRARPQQGPAQVISESARWLRKSGDNPDLLCVRGKGLYGSGQVEAALKHFSEALRLDPDHSGSRAMRKRLRDLEKAKEAGKEAFGRGKYSEAVERYTEAMQVDPDNIEVNVTLYTNRATAHFKCGNFAESIADCNCALDAQPRHLKALLRRAACRMELEAWKEAITDYEAAHNIDPDEQSIKQSLRQAKIELKKAGRKCLYKLLGVTRKATDHEIKKAYKRMALQYHPDRHAGASDEEKAAMEVKFKELGEAFEVLSDPQKKQRWDNGETLDEINGNGGGGGGHRGGGMDPHDIFRMYTGGGGFQGFGGGF